MSRSSPAYTNLVYKWTSYTGSSQGRGLGAPFRPAHLLGQSHYSLKLPLPLPLKQLFTGLATRGLPEVAHSAPSPASPSPPALAPRPRSPQHPPGGAVPVRPHHNPFMGGVVTPILRMRKLSLQEANRQGQKRKFKKACSSPLRRILHLHFILFSPFQKFSSGSHLSLLQRQIS